MVAGSQFGLSVCSFNSFDSSLLSCIQNLVVRNSDGRPYQNHPWHRDTWRVIPLSKRLVTPMYKPFRPFGRGISLHLGDLRSSWLFTTYKSWDDPPSIPAKTHQLPIDELHLMRKRKRRGLTQWCSQERLVSTHDPLKTHGGFPSFKVPKRILFDSTERDTEFMKRLLHPQLYRHGNEAWQRLK